MIVTWEVQQKICRKVTETDSQKLLLNSKTCKQELPACFWAQIARNPFHYTITPQILLAKCNDWVSTKRRPKTEDQRPKTEDRRPKIEDRKTKTLIFFARIRHGQLQNQAKAFLSANRCENNVNLRFVEKTPWIYKTKTLTKTLC